MGNKRQKSPSLKARFNYWFDNRMANTLGLVRVLLISSLVLAIMVAALSILFHFSEQDELLSVIWDSIATVINAWMPYSEDGSPGYIALMSVIAILGLLFTSVLIGFITSAIEERIIELKKGNSLVLECSHIVVLGFYPGEYTLLNQLILAAEGKPDCVVLAGDLDRDEMEQYLKENLDAPKNFRIICRTADITDPASIEKCAIENCRTVIISPAEDTLVIKAALAVSALMLEKKLSGIRVNAIISREQYRFPQSLAETHNISTLQTDRVLAKMIAHSCTQTGLSETFREIFNFEGSEFYLTEFPGMAGLSFEELMLRVDHAVPSGVFRDGKMRLNPPGDYLIQEGDCILVFAENSDSARFGEKQEIPALSGEGSISLRNDIDATDTVIIGGKTNLPLVLQELPENVTHVYLVDQYLNEAERERLDTIAADRDLLMHFVDKDLNSEDALLELARLAEHIVILSDHEKDDEDADMEVIFLLLNFRELRTRYGLKFNITVEMQKEHNQKLVGGGDHTDFLVASSMASLILAQMGESPELMDVFREILSNKGAELYLKNAAVSGLTGTYGVRELRRIVLQQGYILLGYVDEEKNSIFNLSLEETITLRPDEDLIVLGEN